MRKQINRISIYQTSKTFSLLVLLVGFIFAIPMSIMFFANGQSQDGLRLLISPFIWMILTFIFYVIFFALYNFIARHFGGVEIEFKDVE